MLQGSVQTEEKKNVRQQTLGMFFKHPTEQQYQQEETPAAATPETSNTTTCHTTLRPTTPPPTTPPRDQQHHHLPRHTTLRRYQAPQAVLSTHLRDLKWTLILLYPSSPPVMMMTKLLLYPSVIMRRTQILLYPSAMMRGKWSLSSLPPSLPTTTTTPTTTSAIK